MSCLFIDYGKFSCKQVIIRSGESAVLIPTSHMLEIRAPQETGQLVPIHVFSTPPKWLRRTLQVRLEDLMDEWISLIVCLQLVSKTYAVVFLI